MSIKRWLSGLAGLRIYNIRSRTTVPYTHWEATRKKANSVQDLDEKIRSLEREQRALVADNAESLKSLEQAKVDYREEREKRTVAEREKSRVSDLLSGFIQYTRGMFEALALPTPTVEGNDDNALRILGTSISPILPYLRKILDDSRAAITSVDVEVQKRAHIPYRGDVIGYTEALVGNTNFNNSNSVAASAEKLKQDLSNTRGSNALTLLERIALTKSTSVILDVAGTEVGDNIFRQEINHAKGYVSRKLYEKAFSEHLSPHLSRGLRAKIAQSRMSALQEQEYSDIPGIVLRDVRKNMNFHAVNY